jgi:hypothetical protein
MADGAAAVGCSPADVIGIPGGILLTPWDFQPRASALMARQHPRRLASQLTAVDL